jgi:hypothetical protein
VIARTFTIALTGGADVIRFDSPPLPAWETFYVIVGTSGAVLVGLQFVVITLLFESRTRASAESIDAFGTPTIVHFVTALLLSAIMTVPWRSLSGLSAALVLCGLGGIAYGLRVVDRARSQTDYKPMREDWLWHALLPLTAYGVIAGSGLFLLAGRSAALFTVGGATLGLVFIGIHNAWDAVTYHVVSVSRSRSNDSENNRAGRESPPSDSRS